MRNTNRIKPFCDEFAVLWAKRYPDLRFGQLLSNFFGWVYSEKGVDIFFPEEDRMMEYFREYCGEKEVK